jgi:hypothetical protein
MSFTEFKEFPTATPSLEDFKLKEIAIQGGGKRMSFKYEIEQIVDDIPYTVERSIKTFPELNFAICQKLDQIAGLFDKNNREHHLDKMKFSDIKTGVKTNIFLSYNSEGCIDETKISTGMQTVQIIADEYELDYDSLNGCIVDIEVYAYQYCIMGQITKEEVVEVSITDEISMSVSDIDRRRLGNQPSND